MEIDDQTIELVVRRSDLSSARFDDVNLSGAAFGNTKMTGSRFDDVNLSDAAFENVNMTGLQISNANLSNMSIEDARLEGATIEGILVTDLLALWKSSHAG